MLYRKTKSQKHEQKICLDELPNSSWNWIFQDEFITRLLLGILFVFVSNNRGPKRR